ncbi:unnamed protein product [Rhizophagus irregularis]|uniref:Uncharacterized protein n=1 Tax=Rhizophagus irregularis TaxID=588596 RepID=A0A915YUT0_9GLOM|nr:unnamed protein product [Rhizophagus irregularis]CAB5345381.1 unnamed protein product [Rhizophagus irregularis]
MQHHLNLKKEKLNFNHVPICHQMNNEKDIVAGDWLGIAFVDVVAKKLIGDTHFVDMPGVTCPIKAGKAFSITQKCTTPELTIPYAIGILIGHHEQTKPYACSVAFDNSSAVPDFWSFL